MREEHDGGPREWEAHTVRPKHEPRWKSWFVFSISSISSHWPPPIAKNDAPGNLHSSEAQTPRGRNDTLGGTRTISRRGEPNAGVGWEAPLRSRKPHQDEDTPPLLPAKGFEMPRGGSRWGNDGNAGGATMTRGRGESRRRRRDESRRRRDESRTRRRGETTRGETTATTTKDNVSENRA